MSRPIACVVADWGTTNLRAWAMAPDGAVLGERSGGRGLLGIEGGRFAEALAELCGDWLAGPGKMPVVMSGMVGSKLGWREAPYLAAPVALDKLAERLCVVDEIPGASVWIVPGVALDDADQPEVMRGEEAQILGALLSRGTPDAVFLLPGTHAKWAIVEAGRLTRFRTYMTGEVYSLLRKSGTLSQLMQGEADDIEAFRRGVERASASDAASLLHALFGVRTLGLLERLPRTGLASYLSGLLIGSEIADARRWLAGLGKTGAVVAIGSPAMLETYRRAAGLGELELTPLDSAAVLPRALLSIAAAAGLVPTKE
jgi:2-dehydro-3-deoxygalactonokinase